MAAMSEAERERELRRRFKLDPAPPKDVEEDAQKRELRRRFKLDAPTDFERAVAEDPRIGAAVDRLTELSRRFSLGWGPDVILAKAREVIHESTE